MKPETERDRQMYQAGYDIGRRMSMRNESLKVTRCGWFAFEGFGRPFEAWTNAGGWMSHGRAFTYQGAKRKAKRALEGAAGGDVRASRASVEGSGGR